MSAPGPLARRLARMLAPDRGAPCMAFAGRGGDGVMIAACDLGAAARAEASALRAWLGPGPRTLVLAAPAGPDFVLSLLGCLLAGITAVPAPPPRPGEHARRFVHIVTDCCADAVLCAPSALDGVRRALDGGPPLAVARGAYPDAPPPAPARRPGPDAAIVQYTSGSTRDPRGVAISEAAIIANCAKVMRGWGMDRRARFVNWLPHHHDMGLMGGILFPLLTGAMSVQLSPWDFVRRPAIWLETIAAHRADFSGGPAFAFAEILRRTTPEQIAALDLSCWRRAYCGAEPAPAGLLDRLRDHLAPAGVARGAVFACYGLAENTLFAAGAPGDMAPVQAPSGAASVDPCALSPAMAAGLRIVDPDARAPLPPGAIGEIWLRGPSQGAGYLGLPADTEAVFARPLAGQGAGEWLRTGDLGAVQGGRLWITGRIKDVVICNGRKIAAPEIEWRACEAHPALNPLAAAAFMPDHARGGRVAIAIETRSASGVPEDEALSLRRAIRSALRGEWGLEADEIMFLPRAKLPRTSSGKVRRAAAAKAWAAGAYADFAEPTLAPAS